MKKLFLSLCFMGLATFAFANNNDNKNEPKKDEKPKVEVVEDDACTTTITEYSNGVRFTSTRTASNCWVSEQLALADVADAMDFYYSLF